MSQFDFLQAYDVVRTLPADANKLEKVGTKTDLCKFLVSALSALKKAEEVISKQADTVVATNAELLKQCELSRKPREDCRGNSSKEKSYAETLKSPTQSIVLRTKEDKMDFKDAPVQNIVEKALRKISVNSTRITNTGDLIVNLPDATAKNKATESLREAFKNEVHLEERKKLSPKLTIVGLHADFDPSKFVESLGEKDDNLKTMSEHKDNVSVIGCWDMKDGSGVIRSKKLAIKVTPNIRNYLILRNQGYVYLNLSRFRVYDRYKITQCFHCYEYNHIAKQCPNKNEPAICGRCSKTHETKICTAKTNKCINCLKNTPNKPYDHAAFSYECPFFEKERQILISRTDFESKN